MKKLIIYILLGVFIMAFLSCTKKIALTKDIEHLSANGQKVQPYNLVKTYNKKRLYLLWLGMALGFGVENLIPSDKIQGQIALAGLLASTPWAFARDKENVPLKSAEEFDEWLIAYNKKNKSNFEFAFQIKEDVYLAPVGESQKLADAYSDRIAAHKEYLAKVKEDNRKIAESWIGIMTVIGISAADQAIKNMENRTTCGVCHGSGKSTQMDEYRNYNACKKCFGKGYIEKQEN